MESSLKYYSRKGRDFVVLQSVNNIRLKYQQDFDNCRKGLK